MREADKCHATSEGTARTGTHEAHAMARAEKVQSYGPDSRQGGKGGSRKGNRTCPEAAVHSTVHESAPNGSHGHGAARLGPKGRQA